MGHEMLCPHIWVGENCKKDSDGDLVSLNSEVTHQILNVVDHPLKVMCNVWQICVFQLIVQLGPILQGGLEDMNLTFQAQQWFQQLIQRTKNWMFHRMGWAEKNVTINHEIVMINPEEFMSNLYRIVS